MNAEPFTPLEWADWLASEERRSFEEYKNSPKRLVSDSIRESGVAGDYAGREILELLQNANDAATEAGIRGRVRIELSPAGLLVANEGAPFTTEGVDSLKLANFSPKRSRKRQMVGNKGLGFRAVLNWTRTPLVWSGGLALAFSATAAKAQQEHLSATSEKLRTLIEQEQRTAGPLIVPLLTFPGFHPEGNLAGLLDNADQHALHARARDLRSLGYSTVIAMPFDGSETPLAKAREQIAQLRPEVLLFARSIAAIEIVEEGKPPTCYRHDPDTADCARIHIGETEVREWRVFPLRGAVPARLCSADRPGGMDYEIVLAVPTNHEAKEGKFYSWFPTEMAFPYPVIAHATLDLQANRQQAQNTGANGFILRKLARWLAEIAAKLADESRDDRGLRMVAAHGAGEALEKFGFHRRLCRFARRCALVPTAGEGLVLRGPS